MVTTTRWTESMGKPFPNSVAQKTLTAGCLFLVLVIGLAVAGLDRQQWAMAATTSALSILTFVIFFQSDGDRESRTEAMRRAIAAASVLTFLVLVGIAMFTEGAGSTAGGVAGDLVSDLRWVVITVVGFYFANDSVRSFLAARYGPDRLAETAPPPAALLPPARPLPQPGPKSPEG